MSTQKDFQCWFKKKYGIKKFKFALREFKPQTIIKNDKRYKVADIYPEKIDGLYFVVHSKKPVKDRIGSNDIYGDPITEHSIRITHYLRQN
jgi:hypothetical protein